MNDELTAIEIADELLLRWYDWSRRWRPKLGAPRVAVCSREAVSSRQYDEDANADRIYQHEMEAIEYCVNELTVPLTVAIGTEMRNRETGVRVWRDTFGASYADALEAVIPVMRKKGLL